MIVMRRHTDSFVFIVVIFLALLIYSLEKVFGLFLNEWIKAALEAQLGAPLGNFLTRLADAIIPLSVAGIVTYAMYRHILHDIAEADAKISSEQLIVLFDPDDPICIRPNTLIHVPAGNRGSIIQPHLATLYRVKVEVGGDGLAEDCRGHITSIKRDGVPVMAGENLPLPFSDTRPPDTKKVMDGLPVSVDVLYITDADQVIVCSLTAPGSLDFRHMFAATGVYEIAVVISALGKRSRRCGLTFHWTGSRMTSRVAAN